MRLNPYLRVVADTVADALTIAGWTAAGGLPTGRRRLARAGVTAFALATALPGARTALAEARAEFRAADPAAPPPAPPADRPGVTPAVAVPDPAGPVSLPDSEPAADGAEDADQADEADQADQADQADGPGAHEPRGRPAAVTVPDRPSNAQLAVAGAALATVVAASAGLAVAGRRLERRWLARLVRRGHPHPHRALGVRMAGVWTVAALPARLLNVAHPQAVTGSSTDRRKH